MFLRKMSVEPRGRFGLDANTRLLVSKIQEEIGYLTAVDGSYHPS
jgi:hypothetical protein